ncbi:MAG: DUF4286 family protein [Phycisphaerae bacterium]|nr:DUF4286 family protein [Phycisphaerae bacterium]
MELSYVVHATFRDAAVLDEWIAWLRGGHLADVMAGGALTAEVVRLDGEAIAAEARYRFASRDAFARYEREFAPRLRAEGMAKFPPERGVTYRRATGVVEAERGRE